MTDLTPTATVPSDATAGRLRDVLAGVAAVARERLSGMMSGPTDDEEDSDATRA